MNILINPQIIYQIIFSSFCLIVVISNILSAKMVAIPLIPLSVPAGLIFYPLTFLLSGLVTELFGAAKAKLMVYMALFMSFLSFVLIQVSLLLPGSGFEEQRAFEAVLGLTGLRVFSSLVSYLISQIAEIQIYATIKQWTGSKFLWLRNNASSCISQLIDTVLIDLIFLWWGLGMHMTDVMPIMLFSYLYKVVFSLSCTPLYYLIVQYLKPKVDKLWV